MAEKRQRHNINKVVALLKVLGKDKRYDPESYSFVMAALGFTTKKLKRKGHVTGQELSDGIKDYALDQFGPMARLVLEHWGIKATDDFGEIVFNMINAGMLGKTEQDSKEDFKGRYDFKDAFDKGYHYTLH
ncbi:MAG: hypothetical protein KJ706_06120 [Candidatus Omnitrophica bacterium]|nr:hypothetical protein [Candidatus Omnitrophota bacterium]